MSAAKQQSPWGEHRIIAETIGQAFADAASKETGTNVKLGIASNFDPEEMLTPRPLPLRATMVTFGRPLRDVLIVISSLKDEVIRPLAQAGALAALAALDIPASSDEHGAIGAVEVTDGFEYGELSEALEECDALYLEASYDMEIPNDTLRVVIGSGLLESANCFLNGMDDPYAEGAQVDFHDAAAGAEDQFESSVEELVGDDMDIAALMAEAAGEEPAAVETPEPATETTDLEAFDALLAEQEAAEAEAAAAIAAAAAPAAPVATAAPVEEPAPSVIDTHRWTDLLSGVEVELSAELGRTEMALGEITSLNGESVLTFEQLVDDPVTVFVNGTPYATARLVVVDGEYGIEIIDVVDQAAITSSLAA